MQAQITKFCCKKCKKEFQSFQIITVEDVDNLMIGGAKIFRLELVCANCGTVNYWNAREKEMSKQTEVLIELLARLQRDQKTS
jgi:hypothetical protein